MAIKIDLKLTPERLRPKIQSFFELSEKKILGIEKSWNPSKGTPVFTVDGLYTSRGWTEWTQGFQFGSALLQFDATGDERFLELGRSKTVQLMAAHVSHIGVHDHGFNNISTYGNLLRLMSEGKIPFNQLEKDFYQLALKISGAIQAARWSVTADGTGYIYSFNGPHSLFIDTMRSLRSLAVAHQLGHVLMGERDQAISLLRRLIEHASNTERYNVYYGEGRDAYDVSGRTAHESIFNVNDGSYRCPSSQQGYSPFSTWTRGLAWAILGFAELLEYFGEMTDQEIRIGMNRGADKPTKPRVYTEPKISRRNTPSAATIQEVMLRAATVTAEFYIENSCSDGVPMWDTGAPNLYRLGNYLGKPANPFNDWEPVDSSAAAIAAQGFLRLGNYLISHGRRKSGARYRQTGLTIADSLFSEPYLATNEKHQGLILHSVYHRPNGWDRLPRGQRVPNSESSMWGDYHARELALLLLREAQNETDLSFFSCVGKKTFLRSANPHVAD